MSLRIPLLLALLTALMATSACTPARTGASAQSFYSTGVTDIRIDVAPPLTLAASGRQWVSVPNEMLITLQPFTEFSFAAYAADTTGPLTQTAHTIISSLPRNSWRFSPESWKSPDSLYLSSDNIINGTRWTIQMRPVISQGDWFSELWQQNSRQTPVLWLAKRWSSNPVDDTRIVAEYREAAPQCVSDAMLAEGMETKGVATLRPISGVLLWARCRADLDAFSARADNIFTMQSITNSASLPGISTPSALTLPANKPNVRKLVGEVEPQDRDTSYLR